MYKVYLNKSNRLTAVRMDEPVDLSNFIGESTTGWKRMVTHGQRNYRPTNSNIPQSELVLLSYGRGACIPVCTGKGDYIPPGYTGISRDIDSLFAGYDGVRCVERAKVVPMAGESLINPGLEYNGDGSGSTAERNHYVYQGDPLRSVPGWHVRYIRGQYTGASWSGDVRTHRDRGRGVRAYGLSESNDSIYVISQPLHPQLFADAATVRIRVEGSHGAVLINSDVCRQIEDGVYEWNLPEGVDNPKEKILSVQLTNNWLTGIDIIND